jgi:hypothetical protein
MFEPEFVYFLGRDLSSGLLGRVLEAGSGGGVAFGLEEGGGGCMRRRTSERP